MTHADGVRREGQAVDVWLRDFLALP